MSSINPQMNLLIPCHLICSYLMLSNQLELLLHSGHQGMNPPLKKSPPSFWPTPPSKYKIVQAPPFCSNPLFMRKVLVSPPFSTKSSFMKPTVKCHEIIVFYQDLTTTGSSEKKILVFFHFTT